MLRRIFITILSLSFFSLLGTKVSAQSLLPKFFQNLLDAGEGRSNEFASSRMQIMILLVLAILIIAAVFYAFLAGWKYIRSQGDQSQIDEAGKAISAIFMGLGAMLVSIIGTVLVFVFFGATLFGSGTFQSCENAPDGLGCAACNNADGGLPATWEELKITSTNPELASGKQVARGSSFGPGTSITSQQICTFCEWEFYQSKDGKTFEDQKTVKFVCLE